MSDLEAFLKRENVNERVIAVVLLCDAERIKYKDALEHIASDLGHPSHADLAWVAAMEALGKDVDGAIEGWQD